MADKVFLRSQDIVTRQIAGEIILVPVKGELAAMQRIFSVDSVAGYIWESIDGNRSVSSILEGVTGQFDVDEPTAKKDLNEFLEELISAGLIGAVDDGL